MPGMLTVPLPCCQNQSAPNFSMNDESLKRTGKSNIMKQTDNHYLYRPNFCKTLGLDEVAPRPYYFYRLCLLKHDFKKAG
jgi:hypothetical protein